LFPPWLSAYRALESEMPSGIPLTNKTFFGKLQETNKITSQNEAQIIVEDSDDNLRRKYAM